MTTHLSTEKKILPDDFCIEVHLDKKGRPYTSFLGFITNGPSTFSTLVWQERLAKELIKLFSVKYNIPPSYIRVIGSWQVDTFLVSLRSTIPIPPKAIDAGTPLTVTLPTAACHVVESKHPSTQLCEAIVDQVPIPTAYLTASRSSPSATPIDV